MTDTNLVDLVDAPDEHWFADTGNCGHCGSSGYDCCCTEDDPCGCADWHPMGSARFRLEERIAARCPAPVIPGQGALDLERGDQ